MEIRLLEYEKHAMETLVSDQNSAVETSQAGGDQSSSLGGNSIVQSDCPRSTGSSGQVRANGTVVLASPAQVKHVVTSSQNTQAVAVPQAGGGVSIVHLAIQPPNQPVHVQSVIQPGPNQQSVIQAPGGATLQSVQVIPKNVILLSKLTGQGSVIQSTDGDSSVHPVQLITTSKDEDVGTVTLVAAEDPKKRREILARRPSYRKILNDLSATDAHTALTAATAAAVLKEESANLNESSQEADSGSSTITLGGTQYPGLLKAIQLATATQDSGIQALPTLTMTNSGSGTTGAIVQYTQNQDGQFFVPVTVSAADLQAYQIRAAGASTPTGLSQSVVSNIQTIQSPQQLAEEASRKRELRLLKNREAAKECRRKKKEYIKCLENRVAVLENQNKALIEELKSLKELYCQKKD